MVIMITLDYCTDCFKKFTKTRLKTPRYNRCESCQRIRYSLPAKRKKDKHLKEFLENNPNVRQVKGFQNRYLVSNTGDVYSITEDGIKQLSPGINAAGYYLVCLFDKGKPKMQAVHRLVGFAFIPNNRPSVKKVINHIDGIKTNNNVENLEWLTYSGNSQHALRTGLQPSGEDIAGAKLDYEKVAFIRKHTRTKRNSTSKNRMTQAELAELFEVSPRLVSLVQKKVIWKYVPKTGIIMRTKEYFIEQMKKDKENK
jgi:hypothetical protein